MIFLENLALVLIGMYVLVLLALVIICSVGMFSGGKK